MSVDGNGIGEVKFCVCKLESEVKVSEVKECRQVAYESESGLV